MLKELSTVVACAALVGCVDARKSFNDFEDHVVDANTSMPDNPILSSIPDATGHFLMAVHVAAAPSAPPITLVADLTVTDDGHGNVTLSYVGSALDATSHQLATDPPAGPQFSATNMPVGNDGSFSAALMGTLPGDANPVAAGTPVDANAVLHGTIISKDLVCGTLTGTALVDLSGSTWASIRIPDGQIGADLPTPVTACP